LTMDNEGIMNKITYIKVQISNIKQLLSNKDKEQILGDPWIIKGLKYLLQTTIEETPLQGYLLTLLQV